MTGLGITVDCAAPAALARFWQLALGYQAAPPPQGWSTWAEFLTDHEVPEAEWDDGAVIQPVTGDGPTVSFLKVPESKVVKNRVHLDLKVSGGRAVDPDVRETRIRAKAADLIAAGAALLDEYRIDGHLDHLTLADPEGNEFCIV